MASDTRQQRALFSGLNKASSDFAEAALKHGEEWGEGLGRQVVEAALAGSEANLRANHSKPSAAATAPGRQPAQPHRATNDGIV